MAEVEFRDGTREIPDHLAMLMEGIDTYTMTYDQAVQAANKKLMSDKVNDAAAAMVRQHLRGGMLR